jgi:hypothetical protein
MSHPQTMKPANKLASPLKIAAEIDAALAAAGLDGPQVEREAVPLYLSFLQEMVDAEGKAELDFTHSAPQDIAQTLTEWAKCEQFTSATVLRNLNDFLQEVQLITQAHATLTDMKQRKLLNLHNKISASVKEVFNATSIQLNQS